MRFITCFLLIIFIVTSCNEDKGKSVQTEESQKKKVFINIHGANALYPLAQIWADHYMAGRPGVKIIVFPASSTKGMTDVSLGLADIGMYSKPPGDRIGDSLMLVKVARDAVLPTVNAMNPELDLLIHQGITPGQLMDIFVNGTITHWNQVTGSESAKKIAVYTRSDLCGAGAVWAEFLGTNQGNLSGTGVYGDAGMTQAIKADAVAIGYDNLRYIFDIISGNLYPKIVAVPIDFNGNRIIDPEEASMSSLESVKKSINSGTIPPPLSRDLYFIVNKKTCPEPALEFLYWTLTEGLSDIETSGYLSLPAEEYATQALKLQEL